MSIARYQDLFGPLWSREQLGAYTLVWASDVLLQALANGATRVGQAVFDLACEQARFLERVVEPRDRVILCVHDPQALPALLGKVWQGRRAENPCLTLAGHFHMPWLRWLVSRRVRAASRLVVCPSLTGNRLAAGGALIVGESAEGTLRVLRYRLASDDVVPVF